MPLTPSTVKLRVVVSLMLGSVAVAAAVTTVLAPSSSVSLRLVSVTSKPTVTVSPNRGLVGGEQLQVRLRGFPADVGVEVSECPSVRDVKRAGCNDSIFLVTGKTGSAHGTFVAQPAVVAKPTTPRLTVCTTQCAVAAVESPKFEKPISAAPATATASVSFKPKATGGLADSSLMDLSWVDPHNGWTLAQQPCDKGTCAVVARSTDRGDHWTELPATPALVPPTTGCTALQCVNGVSGIAFASSAVGYLYGPGMFMTTDGGKTWQPVTGPKVASMAVGDGQVFRVVYTHGGCPGVCTPSLQVAPVGSTAWRTVLGPISVGTATGFQILTSGPDVYLVIYGNLAGGVGTPAARLYRSVDGGATFQELTDPCVGKLFTLHVLTALAAVPGGVLQGLCTLGAGTGSQGLITSTDAGSSWQTLRPLPSGRFGVIAAASASTIAVATGPVTGSGTKTVKLLITTDGGGAWKIAATDTFQLGTVAVAWLGFETSHVGWWVADPHSIRSTIDGGLHWHRMPFR